MRHYLVLLFLFSALVLSGYPDEDAQDQAARLLKERLIRPPDGRRIVCQGEMLCGSAVLADFYTLRNNQPAWLPADSLLRHAPDLIRALSEAEKEGLRPEDYHLGRIRALFRDMITRAETGGIVPAETRIDLELLLTDAFLLYASHLLSGRVDPETIQPVWTIQRRFADLAAVLQSALDENTIAASLAGLAPRNPGYKNLKQALTACRVMEEAGGWPRVPDGPAMVAGDSGPRVRALKQRLRLTGDGMPDGADLNEVFDASLERGVRIFQHRHGLKEDGIVGPDTLEALNVPAADRIDQVRLNLERWRWLPDSLGRRYLLVNIADFRLHVIEDGRSRADMRVIVGKRYRHTPVFSGKISYMVVNPAWHIPRSIAVKDILPKVKKDPGYLKNQGIRVYRSWDAGAPELSPDAMDWTQVTAEDFSYRFVQSPGPANALGRIKFIFPNKFDVYLHDSPAKALFQATRRSFSSGCIRVEKPVELAAYLLSDDPDWDMQKITALMESGDTRTVSLTEPLDVHLLYWTAWVDEGGAVHFREDIYQRDTLLHKALNAPPSRGK